jgi:hypothetical protein
VDHFAQNNVSLEQYNNQIFSLLLLANEIIRRSAFLRNEKLERFYLHPVLHTDDNNNYGASSLFYGKVAKINCEYSRRLNKNKTKTPVYSKR